MTGKSFSAALAAAKHYLKKGIAVLCTIIMVLGLPGMAPAEEPAQTYEYTFTSGGDSSKGTYYITLHSSSGDSANFCGPEDRRNASAKIDGITINAASPVSFRLIYSENHSYLDFYYKPVALSIDGGSKYITKVEIINYGYPPGKFTQSEYTAYSKTNRATTFSDTLSGNLSGKVYKLVITTSSTPPEKENGAGSVSLDDWTYGEEPKAPTVSSTTNGTGSVSYRYLLADRSTPTTTVNSGADSEGGVPENAGTYYVQATFAETDNYKAVTATDSFTINKAAASYTAPVARNNLKYNGSDQLLVDGGSVTLPPGGSILYSLSKDGAYSESIPSAKDAGDYTVWYKVAGNDNIAGTDPQSLPVTIAKRNITLTSASDSKPYDGTALTNSNVAVTGDGFVSGEGADYTVTGSRTDAGTSKNAFSYTMKDGTNSNNYIVKQVEGDLTVTATNVKFTAPAAKTDLFYNGNLQELVSAGLVAGNAGEMQYSLDGENYSASIPVAKTAGRYTVYYRVTGDNTNYKYDKAFGKLAATINRMPVKVSGITASDKSYDGTTAAALNTAGAVLAGKADGDDLTISVTGTFSDANAGRNKKVTISDLQLEGSDAGNYILAAEGQQAETTAAINPRAAVLTWGQSEFIYDGKSHRIEAAVSNPALDSDTFTMTYLNLGNQTITATDAGNYKATLTSLGNPNYTIPDSTGTKDWSIRYLDVQDAAITGTPGGDNWYVSDVDLTAPAGCTIKTSDSEQWKDSITFTEDGTKTVTYRVKNDQGQISDNKTATFKIDTTSPEGEITIRQNTFTTLLNKVTFGQFFKDQVEVTVSGNDDTSGIRDISYYKSDAGMTEEQVRELADDQWQNLAAGNSGKFTINANDQCVIYGRITDAAGNVTFISSDGVVLYQDAVPAKVDLSYTKTTREDQTAEITLNGNTVKDVKNGSEVLKEGSDYEAASDGKITFKGAYLDTLAAGVHELTVSYDAMGLDYVEKEGNDAPAVTTVKITVNKQQGVVTDISDISKTYDGEAAAAPSLETTNDRGEKDANVRIEYKVKGADDSTYTAAAPVNAGDYVVRVTAAADENYREASGTAEFSIAKALLTVTAEPAAVTYGEEPENNGVTYDGFAGKEEETVLKGQLDYSYSYKAGDDAGFYEITPEGLSGDNYDIRFVNGILTVDKADAEVQMPKGLTLGYNDKEQELVEAGTTSGGTMEYSLDGNNWSSDIPTASKAGEYQVLFRVSGGKNYNDVAENSVKSVIELPKSEDVITRVDVSEGIGDIPESLANAGFDSEKSIREALYKAVLEKDSSYGEKTGKRVLYDATLMYSVDGGKTWIKATKDNFPTGGITVTFPYPKDTNKDEYEFVVAHMFAEEMNGHSVGEIETPVATKTDEGIQVAFTSLSPVMIAWNKVEKPESAAGSGTAGGTGGTSGLKTPGTGDDSDLLFFLVAGLAAAAAACVAGSGMRRRKN